MGFCIYNLDLYYGFAGSGQYGDVYEGIWLSHSKTVAVKTLKVKLDLIKLLSFNCFLVLMHSVWHFRPGAD